MLSTVLAHIMKYGFHFRKPVCYNDVIDIVLKLSPFTGKLNAFCIGYRLCSLIFGG